MNESNRKNEKGVGVFALVFVALLFAIFVYTRIEVKRNAPQENAIVIAAVLDTSGSTESTLTCDALRTVVKDSLAESDREERMGKNSHFELVTTGIISGSLQGDFVMDEPIPPLKKRVGIMRSTGKGREEFLNTVQSTCRTLPRAEASAIFNAIQLAIEHLRGRGCGTPQVECSLWIASDALENVDKRISDYLYGANLTDPPAILDNSIIARTTWCGYAQTGPGGPQSVGQAIIDRWRPIFKADIALKPYCAVSKTSASALHR